MKIGKKLTKMTRATATAAAGAVVDSSLVDGSISDLHDRLVLLQADHGKIHSELKNRAAIAKKAAPLISSVDCLAIKSELCANTELN